MKVLYSQLKFFIPSLRLQPKRVAEALSLTGLLVDKLDEVRVGDKKDTLFGLEVRQNRPDCQSVLGVAREVAAYFDLPLVLPKLGLKFGAKDLAVKVNVRTDVRRVCVLEVTGLDNTKPTPAWIKDALRSYGMHSVSLLVDISNYAMLMTGYPNHVFDAGKVVGGLVWQGTPETQTFSTLDGTALELTRGKELVISDSFGLLVLASAIGGRRSAISSRTTAVLAEVAVYDPLKMRQDARHLKVATEASTRLEKELSVEHCRFALEYLAYLYVSVCKGVVSSKLYEHAPKDARTKPLKIKVLGELFGKVAGVTIGLPEATKYLRRLGFGVTKTGNDGLTVDVPSWRGDVKDDFDLVEEVIRMKGFDQVPARLPSLPVVAELTSPRIKLAARLRTHLVDLGLDEVLTLPMVTSLANTGMNYEQLSEVLTQNAINEELPAMRLGLLSGLLGQQHEYLQKYVWPIGLFEIGKVFSKLGKKYLEGERCGILIQTDGKSDELHAVQDVVEKLLRHLGAVRLVYEPLGQLPGHAVPTQAWLIVLGGKQVGVLYAVKDRPLTGNRRITHTAFAELKLEELLERLPAERSRGATELLGKLIVLDANVEAVSRQMLDVLLSSGLKQIGKHNVWAMQVVDSFALSEKVRYTVRVSYTGLTDSEAKSIHNKVFGI